jgi:hypothetical protein
VILPLLAVPLSARAQALPQGLTCGLSYLDDGGNSEPNTCNGVYTVTPPCIPNPSAPATSPSCDGTAHYATAPGFLNIEDGDYGKPATIGYRHQELAQGATGAAADSTHFVLPQGAMCGFHHTATSPGRTCMGFNAARAFADPNDTSGLVGCPVGWTAHRVADFNSPGYYWVWCGYNDPNGMTANGATLAVSGVACGGADANPNIGASQDGSCQDYDALDVTANPPAPLTRSARIDDGRPAGYGLVFFDVNGSTVPAYEPSSDPPPFTCPIGTKECCADSGICQKSCTNVSCE